jgi:hypothetical protein
MIFQLFWKNGYRAYTATRSPRAGAANNVNCDGGKDSVNLDVLHFTDLKNFSDTDID